MKRPVMAICFIFPFLMVSSLVSAGPAVKSTLADQEDVEVTVYNNDLGLIKDTRRISLPPGEGELKFMDVASAINPVTVLIKSLNAPDQLRVLEQNYEYDLISPQKLLDKYVGKTIKIIDVNEYQGTKETVEATLLSNNSGEVYRIGGEIYLGHPGYKVLPEIPENLIAKPTLTWLYQNAGSQPHQVEVSYLTQNINWKADYVVSINRNDTKADLSGWVTIDNQSGAEYKDARLKLVAGDVHQVTQPRQKAIVEKMDTRMMEAVGAPQFEEQAFFEYHVYDLQRRATIKDKQTKQINLLEASDAAITKEYLVKGQGNYYYSRYQRKDSKVPVEVFMKFKNSAANHLGMPLPAGVMRLYKADSKGSLQFIGEDKIEHTPKDEEVKLKMGKAFDVVAERAQTDFQRIGDRVYETEWEITLRNHKEEDITVIIEEPLSGDWTIVFNSHPYKKIDAFKVQFSVPVPRDGEVKVRYKVRART